VKTVVKPTASPRFLLTITCGR